MKLMQTEKLITQHLDTWTQAIETKSTAGRGSSNKLNLVGIQKLRELILEMAVRGLLVPQDSNDEPASVLLEKIAAEKAQLIKDKKIKKTKALPEIGEDEKPFNLPIGWGWVRLGDLFLKIESGGTPSKRQPDYWDGDIPWASVKDLNVDMFIDSTQDLITQKGLDNGSRLANKDDILICTRMGLGKIAIVQRPMAFNQDLKSISLPDQVDSIFFINSYKTLKIKGTGTTVAGIKQEQLLNYVFGLPPLKEQKRIVAKVDELMALCDQLESQTLESIATHQTLVETLLGNLVNPENTAKFGDAWALIAQNFDVLFTTEHIIDTLKQTILQLAVMGKLVPQNPNDESASELIKKIAAEKAQLVADKKIKKSKPLPEITEAEKPFDLPSGWEWVRLGSVSADIHYGFTASANNKIKGVRLLRITDIQDDKVDWETVPGCEIEQKKTDAYLLENNDILIARTGGTVGKSYLVKDISVRSVFASYLIRVRKLDNSYADFYKVFLGSELYWSQLRDSTSGTGQPNVNGNALKALSFAIPPIEEQKRIVSKVNELMTLCDQLKSQLQIAQQTQINLAQSIAQEALA